MAKIGLIDVDGHNFPNLALMRISAYHKFLGDDVEWYWGLNHYDIVYMSKIFSDAYSPDIPEPINADKVIKGGTGYCISLGEDGKEHFDQSKNQPLPPPSRVHVPRLFHLPRFRFCRQHDKPWMPSRMFLLPCGFQRGAMLNEGGRCV